MTWEEKALEPFRRADELEREAMFLRSSKDAKKYADEAGRRRLQVRQLERELGQLAAAIVNRFGEETKGAEK